MDDCNNHRVREDSGALGWVLDEPRRRKRDRLMDWALHAGLWRGAGNALGSGAVAQITRLSANLGAGALFAGSGT
ncbi:hypothetical protein [Streptomyces sp. NPDC058745]|uniref:hypothetical protein n=1 Tax=Streptomyces sp. NPDC058745 TaxID=3346621 RepID=UPI0036B69208